MRKGHCGRRVFSLLLSLFNCKQFHILRTCRASELELELIFREYWGIPNVRQEQIQCPRHQIDRTETERACSPHNWTSVFTNRNSVRIPSLFTHIGLKVPSGSVLTTRASSVFKSSTSNWRFSRATFPNRTEWAFISRANPVFKSKHKSNLFAV